MKNIFVKMMKSAKRTKMLLAFLLVTVSGINFSETSLLKAQQYRANPSNWMYPEGNMSATKHNQHISGSQNVDSMKLKWFSNLIRGDVQPLIGNIVQNPPIIPNSEEFPFAPNEICAVIGDTLFILDGSGKSLSHFYVGEKIKSTVAEEENDINYIIGVSALLDTASTFDSFENSARTLILGFETVEAQRNDSLAVMYLGGWKHNEGKFSFLERLSLNLGHTVEQIHNYLPYNYSASVKPIYARKRLLDDWDIDENETGAVYTVYATVDMAQPKIGSDSDDERPYFRGLTSFNLHTSGNVYPSNDRADNYQYRIHLGPQVSFAQPSISRFDLDTVNKILLPCFPNPVPPNNLISNLDVNDVTTEPDKSYMFNFTMKKDGDLAADSYSAYEFIPTVEVEQSARVRSYFVELTDAGTGLTENYILATTEYNGTGNPLSSGRSGLFLFNYTGDFLYDAYGDTPEMLPFYGDKNHFWSIAVGNVDGPYWNQHTESYPNNPGNEIIATQSSRDFAYAGSKIMILRYNSRYILTPKPSPPGTNLHYFDTICTQKIQGWVAAVNDLDGADGKDEIVLVNGSKIMVLRMNDYASQQFREGFPFDTVFIYLFDNQTVTSVAIADVDGDRKNDIIATTNEGIYILGTPLERTIDVISFSPPNDYQTDWCFGDTVKLQWKNIIQGNSLINILFQETVNEIPISDSIFVLEADYPNSLDTANYDLVIDSYLAGKEGMIIVQSATNPAKNADTTGILKFHKPTVETDFGEIDTIFVGSKFSITGIAYCTDSISLYYSFDSTNWVHINDAEIDSLTNLFELTAEIPCLEIFDCNQNITDTTVLGKIIYKRYNSIDSTNIYPLTIKPAQIPITLDTCEFSCPTRTVRWEITDTTISEGTFNILMSIDSGKTFEHLNTVPISAEIYFWNVPTNVTNPVILRFCSEEHCYQFDTLIWNYQPKYIRTVAPNPFKIPHELEIIYQVDEDSEATIRIIDQANRFVKDIIKNERRMGGFAYCEKWDGRLEDKTPAANGMYYIMLELSTGIKEIYPLYIRN